MAELLEQDAPRFSIEEAEALARERFGVAGAARLLTSERDQNFRISCDDGQTFVLKIANPAEDEAVVVFQNAVLEHIAATDAGVPTPRVVRALNGAGYVHAGGSRVRLMTWLAGSLMHQVERTPTLRASLGAAHARMALALKDCDAPAPPQDLLWDLQHALRLRRLLEHIAEPADRAMLTGVLDRFQSDAEPMLARLLPQVIHNDLNPHNVVIDDAGRVSGIIDFGDMVRAPLICDVAVAAAYHVRPGPAPLADAADYVAAFHAALPLHEDERALLPLLIETRMAMSVLITTWRATLYPENRDYILRNAPTAWAGLRAMQASGADRRLSL